MSMTAKVTREVVKTTEVTEEYDTECVYVVSADCGRDSFGHDSVLISSNEVPANYSRDAEAIRTFLLRAIPNETYRALKVILSK